MSEVIPFPGKPARHDGRLAENVMHFARALRRAGLKVGPSAVVDALEALQATGLGGRDDLYWTLHAVFVKRREDRDIYDQAFRLFWRKRALLEKAMSLMLPTAPAAREPQRPQAGGARVAEALFGDRRREAERRTIVELDARLTVSDLEILQRKDFAQMSAAELAAAKQLVRQLVMPKDRLRIRRMRANPHGRVIDPRRTLRASLRAGGDLIDLKRRGPADRHPPIVALLDISGSMSQYTRVVLHFLHALGEKRRVSTFLFGTRLTNVTRHLRARDPDEALSRCAESVPDWSGGTRIATSLHTFNKVWSRRVLGQGAIVLLVTDGLERDAEVDSGANPGRSLSDEMDRLHKSCRRLIWLNPLLRYEAFEAKARGIRLMLPKVDEFRPVHDLESMAELVAALSARRADRAELRRWQGGIT
jgi:uncharacterized protein with von Willebrand factor type A (vWA) domain